MQRLALISLFVFLSALCSAQGHKLVKIYLVRLDDGKTPTMKGKKFGCNDLLVPVEFDLGAKPTMKAAYTKLFSLPSPYKGLNNSLIYSNLKFVRSSIKNGLASVYLRSPHFIHAGHCADFRVWEQLNEVAKQFPGVKRVQVYVDGKKLQSYLDQFDQSDR